MSFKRAGNLFVSGRFDFFQFTFEFFAFIIGKAHPPRELVRVDHDSFDSRRDFQRVIFDVFTGATENRMQQFFFRCQFGFTFGTDLADQNIARLDVRPDLHDPILVQVAQRLFADIGNVASEFLASQLGFANLNVKVFDMNRSISVIPDQFLADDDGIFVVESIEGHEADQDVSSQCQFSIAGRRAIGDDLTLLNFIAEFDQRLLVLASPFVEALVLFQLIMITADFNAALEST